MIRLPRSTGLQGSLLCLLTLLACSSGQDQSEPTGVLRGEAAQALQQRLEADPALQAMLAKSIARASELNPDTLSNPVQSVEQFLAYVERAETSLPWDLVQADPSTPAADIFAALVALYFVLGQPLPELEEEGLYRPTLQYYPPVGRWLTTFNRSWARYLDSEASWSPEEARRVQEDPAFGLQNGWYEDPSNWSTFNEFFARYLSSPAVRPITSPDDDAVVVSFADAVPMGTWAIDGDSDLLDPNGVAVKSMTIRNVAELLGDDSQYRNAFANGTLTHSFLSVNDYHRYHFPVSGTIREASIIQGINPTGGETWWDPEERRVVFDPSPVGWQTLETRARVIVETDDYGLVALMPVGMAVVGSVNLERSVTAGARVEKGDMLGYFLFGGSDFIVLFQETVAFTIEAPGEGGTYEHVLMGERLGRMTRR